MKRPYEFTFIVRIDANEDAMRETIAQVQSWVEQNEMGKVNKVDHWGRRRLAYEIDRQREGYYVYMEADIDTTHLPEVERNLKIAPGVLRYLFVRPD